MRAQKWVWEDFYYVIFSKGYFLYVLIYSFFQLVDQIGQFEKVIAQFIDCGKKALGLILFLVGQFLLFLLVGL